MRRPSSNSFCLAKAQSPPRTSRTLVLIEHLAFRQSIAGSPSASKVESADRIDRRARFPFRIGGRRKVVGCGDGDVTKFDVAAII